jgi:hypothetical protein
VSNSFLNGNSEFGDFVHLLGKGGHLFNEIFGLLSVFSSGKVFCGFGKFRKNSDFSGLFIGSFSVFIDRVI